jgi:hypothetical protein
LVQGAASPSEKDWQDALAVIRQVALDTTEAEEHRANAVAAYAKLLVRRGRHGEALEFCRKVLTGANGQHVADAALRAGCFVARHRHGHLRAEFDFLATASHGRAATVRNELLRAIQALDALAGKAMTPPPVTPRWPHWAAAVPGKAPGVLDLPAAAASAPGWYPRPDIAPDLFRVKLPTIEPPGWYRFEPGKAHPALHVTHPKMAPPHWYSRVPFPPLKEPRKP